MSTPSAALAEAYVMRKLHKQKMKKTTENTATAQNRSAGNPSSAGCFPLIFKKVHPSAAPPSSASSRFPPETAMSDIKS
nr:Transcription factor 7-like [Ipomoea batatas]GMD57116.1 Transcription factor 7-like [Ipomoea batatas]